MTKMTWRFTTTLLVAEAPRLKSPEISFSLPLSLDSEAWWDFSREVGGGCSSIIYPLCRRCETCPPHRVPPGEKLSSCPSSLQWTNGDAGSRKMEAEVQGCFSTLLQRMNWYETTTTTKDKNVELQVCQPPPGFSNLCLQQLSVGTRSSRRSFAWSPVWASELDNTARILLMLYVILMTDFNSVCAVFRVAGWR